MAERAEIIIKGVVQGVGFRPYVYALAEELGIKGFVTNTAAGVLIEAEGDLLPEFLDRLPKQSPPLSRILGLTVSPLPLQGSTGFEIRASRDQAEAFTLVPPDVSVCPDCLRELLDPSDRRYLYPFINCTNCGPRYSITRSVPYDRPNTTMSRFTQCPECEGEYHDPKDRRFHAQPNACPKCGPVVEFRVRSSEGGVSPHPPIKALPHTGQAGPLPGREREIIPRPLPSGERIKVRGDALIACIDLLRQGGIVAIKGIGGFHLACDATNEKAVRVLRERKRRSNKPFGVMMPDVETITQFCEVSEAERELLESGRRPIALLRKRGDHGLSGAVSPNNKYLGCMLPYTPLHYLLFYHPAFDGLLLNSALRALVMTSGNLSEEPIVRDDQEAIEKLSGIVDGFLLHDRDIFMRVDDSVVRVTCNERQVTSTDNEGGGSKTSSLVSCPSSLMFIRRSRGYAPEPIALSGDGPEVLGCGADLKNTFTLTKGGFAIPSQHIGDMENYETLRFFEECLENLKKVYRVYPVAIVHDLHPGYLSTRWAVEQGTRDEGRGTNDEGRNNQTSVLPLPTTVSLHALQHHYAHIGSVMAEHGLSSRVIGVAMDGTGYGTDGNIWGGEFMVADTQGFERCGQFKYLSLPGGEAAIREPWRTSVSMIDDAAGEEALGLLEEIGFFERYGEERVKQVAGIARSPELSPLASGAGRVFDAVAAILGICDRNTFEGEAPMALEFHVQEGIESEYPFDMMRKNGYTVIDFAKTILGVIDELRAGRDRVIIATKFHNTVSSVIRNMVVDMSAKKGITDVALSGGTFQNAYLLERCVRLLKEAGMQVYTNQQVPCNDACISLGQAYIVRERLRGSKS